jgi:hypothetical protein
MHRFAFLLWALGPSLCAAAPSVGVFTIVEGEVAVIRDAVKFAAAEGLRLQPDDIVHTADNTNVVRIEFNEGSALDVGPATRLLVRPRYAEPRSERPSRIYVSQGWIKLTAAPADKIGVASPLLDITEMAGATVARFGDDASFLFAESGSARLAERSGGTPARRHQLSAGTAYERRGNEPGVVMTRPGADMLKSMPRSFVDSLPLRASLFNEAQVEPASPSSIAYEDVSSWLNGERSLRPAFVKRWTARAKEPRFRAALIADLRSHPEWDRVLFPEKYIVKRPEEPAQTAAASAPSSPVPRQIEAVAPAAMPAPAAPADDPARNPLRPWEARRP